MGIPQKICLMFTVLTAFGFGIMVGRKDGIERWQVVLYLCLIILGMTGVNS